MKQTIIDTLILAAFILSLLGILLFPPIVIYTFTTLPFVVVFALWLVLLWFIALK